MKIKSLLVFVSVTIVIVSTLMFISFWVNSGSELERLRRAMIDKYIDPKHVEIAEKYHLNPKNTFENVLHEKIEEVVPFGRALLSMYQMDKTKTQYLTDVEDLISRIDSKLGAKIEDSTTVPWGDNWYHCSISLTRMLAMYEYIGEDEDTIKTCHRRIDQITPRLDRSLGNDYKGKVNIIYIAIPRLLTVRKNLPDQYQSEITSTSFDNLKEMANLKPNATNAIKNGIYQDYSFINNDKIANFSALTGIEGFSLEVYNLLGFGENLSTYVTEIFNRVLHPKLDFIPYGLFGRDQMITCEQTLKNYWPNYVKNKNYDVNIFPLIGLGVFKSQDFVFSVRVQRVGIAAYEFDQWYNKSALGWVQMRKLYHKDVDYRKYKGKMLWEELKVQPGVISFADDANNNFDGFQGPDGRKSHTTPRHCHIIKTCIGHLKNHNDSKLLYWFNKYQFSDFYGPDVKITEMGVCTNEGLVMHYEISNTSGKKLKLIMKDKDIGKEMNFDTSAADSGTEISIPSGSALVKVDWSQLLHKNSEPTTVAWDEAKNSMSITFEGDSYSIEQFDGYHVVKCKGKIILAGNSSSLRNDTITHNGIKYTRNSDTLMYEPPKNN